MSLWSELRRRNVLKVGAAYLVVAWLLVQVVATLAPQLQLPEWTPRLITLLLMVGFPIALLLAWFLERTPEGFRVEPAATGNRRVVGVAILLAALALGWYFRIGLPEREAADEQPRAPATGTQSRLAVLPFANFSPDPANGFFADGLHDDVLAALSRLQGVDVISRTTMQTFRDSKLTLAGIAQNVAATHVLEGSVRRDESTVRLTVQLIDAGNDRHLWAETYDRPIGEAQTLQRVVAADVAKALRVTLAAGATFAPATAVPAAYDLYLKARLTAVRADRLKLLDSVLLLDPGFARARAHRANTACHALWFDDLQTRTLAPQARADIEQARREVPGLPAADIADAQCIYRVELDYPRALAASDRVLATNPNDADALAVRASLLRKLGRFDEAIAVARRGVELDPHNAEYHLGLGEILRSLGRHREAVAVMDAAIARFGPMGADTAPLEMNRIRIQWARSGDSAAARASLPALDGRVSELFLKSTQALFEDSPALRLEALALAPEWITASERVVYPRAVLVAREAYLLGDRALLEKSIEEAGRLYAALPGDTSLRPGSLAFHAVYLALRGDAAAAVDEALRATAPAPEGAIDTTRLLASARPAMHALAFAGAKDRALDLLERHSRMPLGLDGSWYHDPGLRRLLGDEPRYRAVMDRIAAKFEQP